LAPKGILRIIIMGYTSGKVLNMNWAGSVDGNGWRGAWSLLIFGHCSRKVLSAAILRRAAFVGRSICVLILRLSFPLRMTVISLLFAFLGATVECAVFTEVIRK
jgi:hypothetical protein